MTVDEYEMTLSAAQQGCPAAQCSLGSHFATLPVPDLVKSRFWYFEAAVNGNPTAMYEIGFTLLLGEGGTAEPTAAIDWLEKAASSEHDIACEARRLLVDLYTGGLYDVPKNEERATYWQRRADLMSGC